MAWSLGNPPSGGNSLAPVIGKKAARETHKSNQDLARSGDLNALDVLEGSGNILDLAVAEPIRRHNLGLQQQGQINTFADQQTQAAADYRKQLAGNLTQQGQDFFSLENPGILEDLNARGLFTSQTARDQAQSQALKEIALNNNQTLSNFDTANFNNINDIRGTGLSALLGGDQSALDSALSLRKAGIQNQFDQAGQESQMAFADMLAQKQQRAQLLQSIIGLGGTAIGGYLGGPLGASMGSRAGSTAGNYFGGGSGGGGIFNA